MSDIVILLFLVALGVFLARYFIRAQSVEYLSMITSLMSMFAVFTDESLDTGFPDLRLFIFFPSLFMLMISALSLTDKHKKRRW